MVHASFGFLAAMSLSWVFRRADSGQVSGGILPENLTNASRYLHHSWQQAGHHSDS